MDYHQISTDLVHRLSDAMIGAGTAEARAQVLAETLDALAESIEWAGVHPDDPEHVWITDLIRTVEDHRRQLAVSAEPLRRG